MTEMIHMREMSIATVLRYISKIKQLKFPTRDYKLKHIYTFQARTLILHKIPAI